MLDMELRYQACNDEQCLLPEILTFTVPIEVVGIEDPIQRINEPIFASIEFGVPRAMRQTKAGSQGPSLVDGSGLR